MGYHDIKLRHSDRLFSNYIRAKRGWRCEKCHRLCRTSDGEIIYKLEASHYWSRRHETVRYDEDNVRVLCFTCHKRMGGHTREENGEYDLWMKELLSPIEYKKLKIRANMTTQKDEKLAVMFVKGLINKNDYSHTKI